MWVIMLKKIVAILLIVLLAGATTACASDQDDDQNVEQFNWALAGYKKAPGLIQTRSIQPLAPYTGGDARREKDTGA